MPGFELNQSRLEETIAKIKEAGYTKVGVQVPDGLKVDALRIADMLREQGLQPILVAEATFGACDLGDHKARKLGAECLIHCGHTQFYLSGKPVEGEIPVFYVPWSMKYNFIGILEKEIGKIEEKRLGIVTTVQHRGQLKEVVAFLEKHGKEVVLGEKGARTEENTQLLGCDAISALRIKDKVDAFLYLGSGHFHPLKVSELEKTVYLLDYMQNAILVLDDEEYEQNRKKEILRVLKYKEEKKWGIIATVKEQMPRATIDWAKKFLEERGKDVYVFVGDRISEQDFVGFGINVFVNCACPRMVDDFTQFGLVNPQTLKYLDE